MNIKINPKEFFELREGFPRLLKFIQPLIFIFIKKVVTISRRIDDKRRYKSIEKYFSAYSHIYTLPTVTFEKNIEKNERFLGKKINPHFVVLCIYNKNKEILVLKEKASYKEWRLEIDSNKHNKEKNTYDEWSLPGNYVHQHENMLECVNRVARNRVEMRVDAMYPLCFVENTFIHDKERVIQKGIAFLVYARKEGTVERNVEFKWVPEETKIPNMYLGNKDILNLAFNQVNEVAIPPYSEIDSHKKANFRYLLHEKTVSKIFYKHSSLLLRRKIIETIHQMRAGNDSIKVLDVSCGDDTMLLDIKKEFPLALVVGNDISWEAISLLSSHDQEENIVLLNHDLRNLPFDVDTKFDFVICKNTLHHLSNSEVEPVIAKLLRIAKILIIVEIENPLKSIWRARVWNLYFVHFLKDLGKNFLTLSILKSKIIAVIEEGMNFKIELVSTIKGRYIFVTIKRNG